MRLRAASSAGGVREASEPKGTGRRVCVRCVIDGQQPGARILCRYGPCLLCAVLRAAFKRFAFETNT